MKWRPSRKSFSLRGGGAETTTKSTWKTGETRDTGRDGFGEWREPQLILSTLPMGTALHAVPGTCATPRLFSLFPCQQGSRKAGPGNVRLPLLGSLASLRRSDCFCRLFYVPALCSASHPSSGLTLPAVGVLSLCPLQVRTQAQTLSRQYAGSLHTSPRCSTTSLPVSQDAICVCTQLWRRSAPSESASAQV